MNNVKKLKQVRKRHKQLAALFAASVIETVAVHLAEQGAIDFQVNDLTRPRVKKRNQILEQELAQAGPYGALAVGMEIPKQLRKAEKKLRKQFPKLEKSNLEAAAALGLARHSRA